MTFCDEKEQFPIVVIVVVVLMISSNEASSPSICFTHLFFHKLSLL